MDTIKYVFGCNRSSSAAKDVAIKIGVTVVGGATIGGGIYASVQWAQSFLTVENATYCLNQSLAATLLFQEQLQNWTTTCTERSPTSPIYGCDLSTMPKPNMTSCQEDGPHIASTHDYSTILLGTGAAVTALLMLRSYVNSYHQYPEFSNQPGSYDVI